MRSIFISLDHDDQQHLLNIRSIKFNPNNQINFIDCSLKYPVVNINGHINRRPPHDPLSEEVKKLIETMLKKSDKLLVLVGEDTHSSLWVKYEIQTFMKLVKDRSKILLMRVKGNYSSCLPDYANQFQIINYDLVILKQWILS